MPQAEALAARVRDVLSDPRITEMRMFGGVAFLLAGNMAVAAGGDGGLMVRVDPVEGERLLTEPGAGPMLMRGRSLKGWLEVRADGLEDHSVLEAWVRRGIRYAESLPPKA